MRTSRLSFAALPVVMILTFACSEDETKKSGSGNDAAAEGAGGGSSGAGGADEDSGVSGAGGSAGTTGGAAGMDAAAGTGGMDAAEDSSSETGTDACVGDAGIVNPSSSPVLFSVNPGAQGLAATGVGSKAAGAGPGGSVYRSSGVGPSHTAGTNTLGIDAADLGLLDTDDIDAIAIVVPRPTAPVYYFSVEPGSSTDAGVADVGLVGSAVRASSTASEVPGDLFVSDASGTNVLWTDEVALGLAPMTMGGTPVDDLNALLLAAPATVGTIYFSVTWDSVGVSGTSVNATGMGFAQQVGCTIFMSTLNGDNTVFRTCGDIGIQPTTFFAGAEVDALEVIGTGTTPEEIWFSVDENTEGVAGSALEASQIAGEHTGDIFAAIAALPSEAGAGMNTLLEDEADLGLQATDNLDALSVAEPPCP